MKTLKFMLAAATAIGLASAAHADQLESSTGFEKWTAGEDVVVGTGYSDAGVAGQTSYFWEYAGAHPEDNESKIVSSNMASCASMRPNGTAFFTGADNGASSKILQVSTGTDPLLRRFQNNGAPLTIGDGTPYAQVYVDTLVKFTVTPKSDTVNRDGADKLMIYVKESPKISGGVESETETVTNLVVKGGFLWEEGGELQLSNNVDYVVGSISFDSADPRYKNLDEWHRLTVQAIPNINTGLDCFPAFKVWLDGTLCSVTTPVLSDDAVAMIDDEDYSEDLSNNYVVFSMVKGTWDGGVATAELRAVGFAGEGGVDDLVISTFDPTKTVVDFTFNLEGVLEGFATSVAYSCSVSGQEGDVAAADRTKTFKCFADDAITVSYTLNANYAVAWAFGGDATTNSAGVVTLGVNGGSATLTVTSTAPVNPPLEPGQQDPTSYTAADATNAAQQVVIGVPAAVVAELTAVQQEAYVALFEGKVVDNGDNTYSVKVDFKDEVAQALVDDATTNVVVSVAAQLSEIAADATGEQTDVSVTGATPGLYYSISYGTAVDAIDTEGDRVMAPASGSLTLQTPAKASGATAGFYKVNINAVPKPVTP